MPEEHEMLVRYQPAGPILWACDGNIRHSDDPTDSSEGGYIPEWKVESITGESPVVAHQF